HQWVEAAGLVVPPNTFPGGRWAWTEANLHFARALGLSHTGKTEAARTEVQKLASLRDTLIQGNDSYWADQVDIQRETATACPSDQRLVRRHIPQGLGHVGYI
ncbi:MAG TPA: hypothetical protein VEI26_03720, partial [Terriglobales bacterium]|nr:hypothetical protein [Terriglobales bacterium]